MIPNWFISKKNSSHAATIILAIVFVPALLAAIDYFPILGQDILETKTNLPANLDDVYFRFRDDLIEVKFVEAYQIRLRGGVPTSTSNEVSAAMTSEATTALASAGNWQRSYSLEETRLDELRRIGESRTGRHLPDLNSYLQLVLLSGVDAVDAVRQLAALDIVDAAYLVPRPVISPSVPDYSIPGNDASAPFQGYLEEAPNGSGFRWAWTQEHGQGTGISICDVEYRYIEGHQDQPQITDIGYTARYPSFATGDHGTAVLGMLGGLDNGWGVKGMVPQSNFYFSPAYTYAMGYDVGNAILECVDVLNPGDVILIEQQTSGPNYDPGNSSQYGLIPVEWYKPWYDDIVTAVANEMVVVEAAGNGRQNLDGSIYSTGNGGHHPFLPINDSGAIIIGAGYPPSYGADVRSAASFTNYGSTVDLQGWGYKIVSAGYGNLYPGYADEASRTLRFTSYFSGTSGASPMVTAAAAILQENYRAKHGVPALAAEIKNILHSTGTVQSGSKHIGPLPDLRAALGHIWGVDESIQRVLSVESMVFEDGEDSANNTLITVNPDLDTYEDKTLVEITASYPNLDAEWRCELSWYWHVPDVSPDWHLLSNTNQSIHVTMDHDKSFRAEWNCTSDTSVVRQLSTEAVVLLDGTEHQDNSLISVSPDQSEGYADGLAIEITAAHPEVAPNRICQLTWSWYVPDVSPDWHPLSNTNQTIFVTMNHDKWFKAHWDCDFEEPPASYTLTVNVTVTIGGESTNADELISVEPDSGGEYSPGDYVDVSVAYPDIPTNYECGLAWYWHVPDVSPDWHNLNNSSQSIGVTMDHDKWFRAEWTCSTNPTPTATATSTTTPTPTFTVTPTATPTPTSTSVPFVTITPTATSTTTPTGVPGTCMVNFRVSGFGLIEYRAGNRVGDAELQLNCAETLILAALPNVGWAFDHWVITDDHQITTVLTPTHELAVSHGMSINLVLAPDASSVFMPIVER